MATGLKTYLVLEDAACLDVERADDVRVARAEAVARPGEVGRAAQQPEVAVVAALLHRGEVDARAVRLAGLGRLGERLEGVLALDLVEEGAARLEEAAVVHADAVHADRHPAEADERPAQSLEAVRKVLHDEDPVRSFEEPYHVHVAGAGTVAT